MENIYGHTNFNQKKKWSHKQKIDSPWISPLAMELNSDTYLKMHTCHHFNESSITAH